MTLPTLKRDKNSPLKGSIKQKLFFQIVAILLLSAALILFVNSRCSRRCIFGGKG